MKKDIYAVLVILLKILRWLLQRLYDCIYRYVWIAIVKKMLSPVMRRRGGADDTDDNKPYTFRPFELTKVDYKCYKGLFDKGINSYPKPRSGHRIVFNGSDIYCFGGFNPVTSTVRRRGTDATILFRELWRFDTFTLKWHLLFGPRDSSDMPLELASNAMCIKENMIVVFGGTGYPFGQTCSNKCFLLWPYNVPKSISLLETTGTKPVPQYGQSILMRGRHLYVVGGTTGFNYSCDIYR